MNTARRRLQLREQFADRSVALLVLLQHLQRQFVRSKRLDKCTSEAETDLRHSEFEVFLGNVLPPFTQRIHT